MRTEARILQRPTHRPGGSDCCWCITFDFHCQLWRLQAWQGCTSRRRTCAVSWSGAWSCSSAGWGPSRPPSLSSSERRNCRTGPWSWSQVRPRPDISLLSVGFSDHRWRYWHTSPPRCWQTCAGTASTLAPPAWPRSWTCWRPRRGRGCAGSRSCRTGPGSTDQCWPAVPTAGLESEIGSSVLVVSGQFCSRRDDKKCVDSVNVYSSECKFLLRQFYTSYYLSLVVIQDDLFIFSLEDLDTLLDDVVSIMIHYELFYLGLQFLKINSKLTQLHHEGN